MEAKNSDQTAAEWETKRLRRRFLYLCLALFVFFSVCFSILGLTPFGVKEFWSGLFLGQEVPSPSSSEVELGVVRTLVISKIALNTAVRSPSTQDDAVLEKALEQGPVHYPGSGLLGSNQNILLFGHSSGLPVVRNQNFKVFNRLKELQVGDEIILEGANLRAVYVVDSVEKVLAGNQRVEIGKSEGKLILSTCNVWGAKEERFVVTAHFVKSYPFKN